MDAMTLEEELSRLPSKTCSARYCGTAGKLFSGHITFLVKTKPPILGWCEECARFLCPSCSLWKEPPEGSGWNLHCPYCGQRLGHSSNEIVVSSNAPAYSGRGKWFECFQEFIRRGEVETDGFREALAQRDRGFVRLLLEKEVDECSRGGYDGGQARCEIALAEFLLDHNDARYALGYAEEAYALVGKLGNPALLRVCCRVFASVLKANGENPAKIIERMRLEEELCRKHEKLDDADAWFIERYRYLVWAQDSAQANLELIDSPGRNRLLLQIAALRGISADELKRELGI